MSLQEALRMMRLELGLTQTDLAEKLNKSYVTINRWENGKGFPSRDNAKKILDIAKSGCVTLECYDYLNAMLMPDIKRGKSASIYGFPDIDRDFMFQLADESSNSLYVIEAGTYNLLYANKKAEQTAAKHLAERGLGDGTRRLLEEKDKRCFHFFGNRAEPCPFCLMPEHGNDSVIDTVVSIPENKRNMQIHARASKFKGKKVYIIYNTDITERDTERLALYQLTNDIPAGVGIYNVYYDNRISLEFMNESYFKMIGAQKQNDLRENGQTDLSLIHAEDRGALWTEIKSAVAEKRDVSITMRMRVMDGDFHTVHLDGKFINRDTEKFTFYCLFHDLDQPSAYDKK